MGVPTQAALTGNPDHPPDNPESATEQLERNHQSDDCKDGPSGLQAVQTDSSEPVEDHVGWIKMTSWSQLEVDPDIFRSVSLRQTLRGGGRLWRKSPLDLPEESRKALWEQSHPAAVLDVFLSHTWRTSGRWKVFALLLQSGWMFLLLSWMGFLVVLVALYKAERGLAMPICGIIHHQRSRCPGHLSCWPFPHGDVPASHVCRGPLRCLLTSSLQHAVLFGRGLHPPGGP